MSITTEPSVVAAPRPTGEVVSAPVIRPEARPSGRLYRVVWRWHFYAGLIVAPVLLVSAATGALYIFRDELEPLLNSRVMLVEPAVSRASYDHQVAAALATCPPSFHADQFAVWPDDSRSTAVFAHDASGDNYRSVYVDPYRGEVLGTIGDNNFFDVVLRIHRTLFVGTPGRIVIELMTCWTIVLLVTGLYLWWPRRRGRAGGVWLPRLRRHPYVALRDLHAVCGAYAWAIALVIASTGLLYTYVWGQGYGYAAVQSGAYDIFLHPPKSKSAADAPKLPLDDVVAAAARIMPDRTLTVRLPHEPDGAYVVFSSGTMGPSTDAVAVIDHASGEVLMHRTNWQFPALGWWTTWNYTLHVGSILGLISKVLWLVASFVLMLMPITGVWMWWRRRPAGQSGFPRKPETRVPRWLAVVITALCVTLPMLAASVIAILVCEWAYRRLRAVRPGPIAVS